MHAYYSNVHIIHVYYIEISNFQLVSYCFCDISLASH
ncbi:hypothetical protein MEQ_04392, partial [Candida albicans P87]